MPTQKQPHIFLIAGEPSGDLIGSRLIKALKEKTKNKMKITGVGGESMEKAGLKSMFDIKELAIMGLMEVLPRIPKLLKRRDEIIAKIETTKPDVIVTIDSPGFTRRVAQKLKGRGCKIPIVHYVAPQVWAWKEKRAATLAQEVDHLLCLLPFEPPYFEKHGLKSTFVGHPVIESNAATGYGNMFRKKHNIPQQATLITLLPGSRKNEIQRLLPLYKQTLEILDKKIPDLHIAIPTVKTVEEEVRKETKNWSKKPIILTGEENRYDAFSASDFAIASSGTVSLELAMAQLPHLVTYKLNPISGWIINKMIKIKYINLINILAKKEIVPECVGSKATPDHLAKTTLQIITNPQKKKDLRHQMTQVLEKLKAGAQSPSLKAAQIILKKIQADRT